MNIIEKRAAILLMFCSILMVQTVKSQLYFQDFEGAAAGISMNTTDLGATSSGANLWIINDEYGNTPFVVMGATIDPTPNQPGGINNSPQSNYLHLTSAGSPPEENAHVTPATPANQAYFVSIATGVNTTANPGAQLNFWFLNSATHNEAEVWVRDGPGGVWELLDSADFTTQLTDQTLGWDSTTYKGNLLDNRNDLHIGFRYEFIDAQADPYHPSFSIDDITVALPDVVEAEVDSPDPLPTQFCPGDQVTFAAVTNSAIGHYQWNFNGANTGQQAITGSTANFEAGNPGTYQFELLVSDGVNQDVFTWQVEIIPCDPPTLDFIGTPRTICAEESVSFEDLTDEGSAPIQSIEWTFPGGTPPTSTSSTPIVVYDNPGFYDVTLTVTDSNGTYDTTAIDYIEVESCPPPDADFDVVGDNRKVCPGACINFEDQSDHMDGQGLIWQWTFEGGSPRISNDQNPEGICYQDPGLYRVTLEVSNSSGTDSRSIAGFIEVDSCLAPEVRFNVERDSICSGNCVQFYNNTRGLNPESDSIVWTFQGADAPFRTSREAEPVVCYSEPGEYTVELQVTNDYGTDALIEQEFISVRNLPRVDIVNPNNDEPFEDGSREILIDRSARLRALGNGGPGSTFRWTPERDISCLNCQTVTVSPRENTFYYVTHTNPNGCERTDSVRVIVMKQYYSGVPEAFSPNGDGVNDELFLRGNGIEEMQFYIYNRHGEKVFESFSQDNGWDGTFKGRDLDPGVFKYFARIRYINSYEEIIQGEVNLVR